MNTSKHTDLLVIGSGFSSAIASISVADEDENVLIITKSPILKSGNTLKSQGGIVYTGETDSPEKLKQDIIKAAGAHIICWKTQNN